MKFLTIDVETANTDYSSLCQIGIAEFQGDNVVNTWSTLINPKTEFNSFNTNIHGIRKCDTLEAPTFDEIYNTISKYLNSRITIHHCHFDRTAINRACDIKNLAPINTQWLDSAKIVRRTWEEFAYSGYGLSNVAHHLNIDFKHHDALEDAIAAGRVVNKACQITGLSVEDWLLQVDAPIRNGSRKKKKLKINKDGHLYGECIVFTGAFKSISRRTAEKIAMKSGCKVKSHVSKKVSILVVGVQDQSKLAGHDKSSKHRKAERLINKGHDLNIISEDEFLEICKNDFSNK